MSGIFWNGKWKGSSSFKIQHLTQFAHLWDTANVMAIQIKGEFVHLNFPFGRRSFSALASECTLCVKELWQSLGALSEELRRLSNSGILDREF